MINTNRIVPITAIDLISMYGLILKASGVDLTVLDAFTTDGRFKGKNDVEYMICSEPMKSLELTPGGSPQKTTYFVPSYDYIGFIGNNGVIKSTGDTVEPDGRTLYRAVTSFTSGGTAYIKKVGF